jgi:cytochrome c oxidase subunit II
MTWAVSSALSPAGPQAARLADLFWVFFGVATVVYVVTMGLLLRAISVGGDSQRFEEARRLRLVAMVGLVTTAVLLVLLIVSIRGGRGLNPLRTVTAGEPALTIRVTARQWWWEFQYPGEQPDQLVITANEMHLPVGKPALLQLVSRDVIHSFWVPSLHGKRDLIPGHDSTTYVQADRPGVYRGQCAEFCGAQHAKMGFLVVAEDAATFSAWLRHQREPAAQAASPVAARGQDVFLRSACPMCHTVLGTIAGGRMGPDLTHLASRTTLGAATVENGGHRLTEWVADAQHVKPGSRMPPQPLAPAQLADLVGYLETLR